MNLNCKNYQHQITLLLYDELAEGARRELETHLRECGVCKEAFDAEKAMHAALAEDSGAWDVPADLLVESRKALADELDRTDRKRSWWRLPAFSVVFTPMRLLESAALIAMGLALGVYVSNQLPRNGTISNLPVDDDTVRQLLFNVLRDGQNPGSRLKAVEVLSQKPTDESIEEALINALVYDEDAGVRMQALEGLKTFANEQHVRAAFMHTLQNDEIAGIRIEAIDALLARNPKDPELAKKLTEATKEDDNLYIRSKVLQFVGTTK